MKLRRLLLVSEPGMDGVFDYVTGLVAHQHRYHPEVTVDLAYSSNRSGAKLATLVENIRNAGGEAVDLKIGNAPQMRDFQAARKILHLVRTHRPQLVHAHSSKAGALCRILRTLWPGFPPVVYTPHAYFGLGGQKNLKARIFNLLETIFGCVGHTVSSSFDERLFGLHQLGLSPRRLVLINNGIDLERFHPVNAAEKQACRIELGLPSEGKLLITVGRDSFQKNYPPVYTAIDRILSDLSTQVFFAHAGAGSAQLGQTLSAVAQKKHRAFAHLDPIERLLFAADAFILTSRYEGLSLGALQAIGSGLKIFLSRVTGNACLERIGFDEISWIDPGINNTEIADRLELSLRAWLAHPVPPGPHQVQQAQRSISSRIQLEKLYRLYSHLVDPSAP